MTDVRIRDYEPRDRRAVWRVHDRALRTAWDAFDSEYNRYLRHVDREFAGVGGRFLVGDVGADRDETPVADSGVVAIGGFQPIATRVDSLDEFDLGSLQASVDEVAQVRSVAVDPAWQGQGIGRELMRGLAEGVSDAGFGHVALQSPAALPATHRFYESLNYEAVETADAADDYVWFHRRL